MNAHRLIFTTSLSLLLFWPVAVSAEPLRVTDFASLGAFPTSSGSYVFNTSGTPILTGPGGISIHGVVAGDIAVFTFDAISVGTAMNFTGSGSRPLALLSYSNVTLSASALIDVSGGNASGRSPGSGGPGGGSGGTGGFAIAKPPRVTLPSGGQGPGGGSPTGGGGGFGAPGGGNIGGQQYGDLALALQGGSGGSGGFTPLPGGGTSQGGGGGGGGAALEIGAIGDIIIGGIINVNGGLGAAGSLSGGGGSGGGILLHGETLILDGLLNAAGGSAGGFPSGGGGGGRILILTDPDGFVNRGTINVSGGAGGGIGGFPGSPGEVTIATRQAVIPEPTPLLMMGVGALVLLAFRGRRMLRTSRSPI